MLYFSGSLCGANGCAAALMDNDAQLFSLMAWLKPLAVVGVDTAALQNDIEKLQ